MYQVLMLNFEGYKNEIATLIKDGYSDDEIFELMKNRYGNYILLNSGEDKIPIY